MTRLRYLLALAFATTLAACSASDGARRPDAPAAPTATTPATPAEPMTPATPATPADEAGYASDYDTVRAGRFDNGRMFTLDEPPLDYFRETYGFTPDQAWFDRARLGALRFATYCSASFVSEDGLILTNHHCARESVTHASVEDGRDYNADGFYARTMAQEHPIEGLFVEQLIAIEDVTAEVDAFVPGAGGPAARQTAIQQIVNTIQTRETAERGEGYRVQVVAFYAGAQYKAYTYRRYDDVRLVFAPETQLGYFGGDPDNFTYPRYSLDFSLFRAYDDAGRPLQTQHFFRFEPEGTDPGELVFVLGNPGSTTRLNTVSQLEFRRDYTEPAFLALLEESERVYGEYTAANAGAEGTPELLDLYFSLGNSRKSYEGRVRGLRDPYVIARRRAAERDFRAALAGRPDLQAEYGDVLERIATNRASAASLGPAYGAFVGLAPGSPTAPSVLGRALIAAQYLAATGDQRATLREGLLEVDDQPAAVQEALLRNRMERMRTYLGARDATVRAVLGNRQPPEAAAALMTATALDDREETEALLARGDAALAADPAVRLVQSFLPALTAFQQGQAAANAEVAQEAARLARARFGLYGTSVPPDATFTLRISDGVVQGYPYNGTVAPPYTTFYGMFDRYRSFCVLGGRPGEDCPWYLPAIWREAEDDLDLATPYNLSSTNDIIGGNSGSPMLNRELEVVGIIFDGNIESLPGNYIFDDRFNRTVSLDVRAMLESLDEVYEMDRIVEELREGGM